MVQAAVTDVVGPTVSADNPDGALGQQIFLFINLLQQCPQVAG